MRTVLLIVSVFVAVITLALSQFKLQLLNQAYDASALQVAQINSEAQTILLTGILVLVGIVTVSRFLPADALAEPKAESVPAAVPSSPIKQ